MKGKVRLSYCEIVTIAVMLGVAGRVISPRFTEASPETKVSVLVDELEEMRTGLDLYQAQHKGCPPPVDSFASFEAAMTTKAGQYGPYLKRIPINPFNNLKSVRFDGEPGGAGKAGWRFDTKTGLFQADNDAAYAAL